MNRTFYRYWLLFLLIPFTHFTLKAQNLTGIWKGYFISDGGEYYKLEFQVSQNNNSSVGGVSYSYLDVRFYGKATMTGNFFKSSSSFRIREIRTVEVRNLLGGATCIMNYNFSYSKSGKEEFLEGTWLGKFERKYRTTPRPTWGDCGGGKVYLRKVTTSDFYIEPFLREKIKPNTPLIENKPPVKKDSVKTKITIVPVKKPPLATTKPGIKPNHNIKTNAKTNSTISKTTEPAKQKIDSLQKIPSQVGKNNPPRQVINTPAVLKTRQNELVKTLIVTDPEVTVKLYDNGEIDDDTISVFLDKKLVLSAKRLTASPLTIKLKMGEDNAEHELVMVAENLGRIPPNTSLMIVECGEQRFDVRITSTEQKNAVVRFKYQKPRLP